MNVPTYIYKSSSSRFRMLSTSRTPASRFLNVFFFLFLFFVFVFCFFFFFFFLFFENLAFRLPWPPT